MTNIKQSLLAALYALVSISVANTAHASAAEPRSIRCGANGCVLVRPAATAQEAQPMSQQLPTMQAPENMDINEPELVDEALVVEPGVEEVDVLAQPDELEAVEQEETLLMPENVE